MAPPIRVGTSGWHYSHWKGPFYPPKLPAKDYLAFYADRFDAVEIDGSFYKLPQPETLKTWYHTVPRKFQFSLKASRFLTHMKKLNDAKEPLGRLLKTADHLKDKLGPIFFQLPPWWKANPDRLRSFFPLLPKGYQFTMEFREPSWFQPPIPDILRQFGVGFCIFELAGQRSPELITSQLVYVRLHGPGQKAYQGHYADAALREWAKKARRWRRAGKTVHVYFDNDQAGYAAKNAQDLRAILAR